MDSGKNVINVILLEKLGKPLEDTNTEITKTSRQNTIKQQLRNIFFQTNESLIENYLFPDLDALVASSMTKDPMSKEWSCNFCGKSHKDRSRIRRHVEVHLRDHSIQYCPYCQKECSTRNSLRVHISEYHKNINQTLSVNQTFAWDRLQEYQ